MVHQVPLSQRLRKTTLVLVFNCSSTPHRRPWPEPPVVYCLFSIRVIMKAWTSVSLRWGPSSFSCSWMRRLASLVVSTGDTSPVSLKHLRQVFSEAWESLSCQVRASTFASMIKCCAACRCFSRNDKCSAIFARISADCSLPSLLSADTVRLAICSLACFACLNMFFWSRRIGQV